MWQRICYDYNKIPLKALKSWSASTRGEGTVIGIFIVAISSSFVRNKIQKKLLYNYISFLFLISCLFLLYFLDLVLCFLFGFLVGGGDLWLCLRVDCDFPRKMWRKWTLDLCFRRWILLRFVQLNVDAKIHSDLFLGSNIFVFHIRK